MKNIVKLFLAVTLVTLVLASCASASASYPMDVEKIAREVIVWDKNLPKEDSVLLFVRNYTTVVTSYNGINVDWKFETAIYLPPGEIELVMNFEWELAPGSRRSYQNMVFKRSFAAGERYEFYIAMDYGMPFLILNDLNTKTEWSERIRQYFPLPPKIVLPGSRGSANQTGETTVIFGEGIFAYDINKETVYFDYYPVNTRLSQHVFLRRDWKVIRETLSAGNNTLNFIVYYVDQKWGLDVIINILNLELTHNFEPGKFYTLAFNSKLRTPLDTEYIAELYEYNSRDGKPGSERQKVKSWKLMEFNRPSGKFTYFDPATGEAIHRE